MGRARENAKLGAVAAGAMLVGGAGYAGAGALIDSGDVKNGSLKLKDLSRKARAALTERAPIVTSGNFSAGVVNNYSFGLTNDFTSAPNEDATLAPPGGVRFAGLAVNAIQAKTNAAIPDVTVTLLRNGNPTGLSCTTASNGRCSDKTSLKATAGSRLAIRLDAQAAKTSGSATVSLAAD